MKKILLVVLGIFLAVNAYAMQFEDLKWGMSQNSVLSLLASKGITVENTDDHPLIDEKVFHYKKSSLYGHPCTVAVTVAEDLGLYKVWIEWPEMADATSFQKVLKDDMVSRYGKPKESDSGQVTEPIIDYDAWNTGDIWKEGAYSITVIGEYANSKVSRGKVYLSYTDDKANDEMGDRLMEGTEWLDY